MLFLDFLCLFLCIVLLNAHPISKSNSHNISELRNKLDNGPIIESYSTDQLLNHLFTTWKGPIFEKQNGNTDETNKLKFSKTPKKHIKFKRITSKVMDLGEFEKMQNLDYQKHLHNSIKTYKVKGKESYTDNNLTHNTDSLFNSVPSFLEEKHVFNNDISMEPTRDDTEFSGTAEIEAILNEIKQREIQVIADQTPSVSNLITKTVTETTFASMPLVHNSSFYPGLVLSTFLLVDNKSLDNFENNPSYLRYSKLHNISLRSLKHDTSTLAHDVEDMLQNKIKKVYRKIKNKISKDFNKEVEKTKTTIKEQINKMNKDASPPHVGSSKANLKKATTKPIPKTQRKPTLHETRNTRNTLFNIRKHKHKLTTLTTHTIPTVGDDLSMLSIVEKLLEKSEEDNAINMLTTNNNFSTKMDKKILFKRNSLHESLKQSNRKLLNNDEDVLGTEYTHSDNNINNDTECIKTDATTEDTSYESLSNKLSYSDYVNGFKYYLKFQKDNEDQKYSNQVRYQAHKHHSVDDIGKFILNKIPQLHTTRLIRNVHDLSTKSEDSWFKKHFFIFMDSNTPKKFHTSQTVSLKPSGFQIQSILFSNQTTKPTYSNKEFSYLKPRRFKKNIIKSKNIPTKEYLDEPKDYAETEARRNRILKKLHKRSNLENHYKRKPATLTSINYRKNGFVDIDLINKPTAIIKLNNKNKKTNKIRNIFNKIRFCHSKHKKKEKRQSQNKFNIFKGLKKMFKERHEPEKVLNSTKRQKIFDYEIMTTNVNVVKFKKKPTYKNLLKIDELKQQVPNISEDYYVPRTFFSGTYINLTSLGSMFPGPLNEKIIYNKNPELGDERKSVSILTGSHYHMGVTSPYLITNYELEKKQKDQKIDDIFNVNIKTNDDVVLPENFNTISYPALKGMTKSITRKEGDDINMSLFKIVAKNKKQTTIATNFRNEYKKQHLQLLPYNSYQNKNKLSKEYHIEKDLKNYVNQKTKVNFKNPVTMSGTEIIHMLKKSPRNNKFTLLFNSSFFQPQISSLNPLNYIKGQMDTKSNRQDIALKTFDFPPTPLLDQTMFGYRKKFNNLTMPDKKIVLKNNKLRPNYFEDNTLFDYEQTTNSLTTPEKELATSYNNNVDITIKRPFTKVSTPPEQYYSTPLPMQMDDFYKFLKSQNIDVESVTAPLFNSLSQRVNVWNMYKKNVSKLSNKHDKMIPNKENLETFHKILKVDRPSYKNHSHANLSKANAHKKPTEKVVAKKITSKKVPSKKVPVKKVPAKHPLEKQKYFVIDKNKNQKNIKETGETHHNEKSNYLLRNEKPKRNLGHKSNLMSHLNIGSMDLFQLDNSHKQPVLNSKKEAEDIDVTIIDLDSKKFDLNAYKELSITNFNKMNINQQLRTKTNLSNYISRTTFIDPERDPLRFTHMYNKLILPEKSVYPPLNRYIYKKTKLLRTQPSRFQIKGHSYKYDIIYQKSNYNLGTDLCEANATLFTRSTVNYRNYPTTLKMEKGKDQWYYRGGNHTVYKNDDSITFSSNKIKKEILNLDHFLPKSNKKEKIVLPKRKVAVATMKSEKQFFFNNKVNNIDDEVYSEPLIQYKSNRSKSQGKASTNNNKYYKRDVQVQDSFTAKDVAALEVVVDLMKSTESFDEKEFHHSFLDIDNQKNIPYIIPSMKPQNYATNAIQVHIALPSNINDKKRSLEPIKVRKIFSAIMSSPVDLKYQIHSFEDDKATKVPSNIISPGLYLLVQNSNVTIPKGNFALKPVRSQIGISNLFLPKSSDSILHYKSNITDLIKDHVTKVTLNPDVIAAVNNQLVNLYENMATLNKTKSKRYIKKEKRQGNNQKIKRNNNWESVRKYFGHDRFGQCRCEINKPMCKSCAESDAVITELIFEFDNLANYMTDHCNEIQTFFSMNPTGGRKLKDTVHRMDTILNNDYKRVKCKCQGRTCKMISTSIDKREHKINGSMSQFLNYLESLADYLQEVVQCNIICDANVHNAAKKCIKTINKCMDKNLNKRSYKSYPGAVNNKSIYSLNDIRVNLICNKDFTKPTTYFNKNAVTESLFERNTNTSLYYDDDEIKEDNKIRKSIKKLLKKYSDKIKFKKVETPQIGVRNNKVFAKKHNKRFSVSYNQIEAPFLADSGGTFWYKYLHGNMREPRQQKNILKEYNTTRIISQKSKLINMNLTTTNFTNTTKFANTLTRNKNNLQENPNEIDDITFNVDTLSHNLNDLFMLLGNSNTVHESTTKFSKLSTLSKKQFSTTSQTSIKTRSKLTTTTKVRTTARPSSKTTFYKDNLKFDISKSTQNTKKERKKESKATKPVSTKTLSPKILDTIKTTTSTSKVGLLNRIVSGSLKFLVNNDKRCTTLAEFKSSNIEHQTPTEYVMTYRKKFGSNTENYSLKEKNYYEIDNNDNSKILTEPTIIIINDIGSSVKHTVSKSIQNSTKSDSIEIPSPDTVKRNSFKLLLKKNNADSPAIEMNDISFNSLCKGAKLKNITQKVSQPKNCEYYDYDNIIHNIRKCLGLTASNLTTPRERKGAINKIFDKFSIQIISDTKRIEPDEMNSNQCTTLSNVIPKVDVTKILASNMSVNKSVSDTSIQSSTTKTTAAIINTTKNKSSKDTITLSTDKTSHTESNSLSRNQMTKHLEEAGEEKLNQICDISSTLAYVSKLQKSMLKNNFEQYVKHIPCHEYNKIPQNFIITSCVRNPSKTLFKLNQKSKPFDNRKRIQKWVWIRDKRSMLKDKTTIEEAKGKRYKDLEKKCLSGDSVPFIVTNCINIDKDNGNEEVNFHKEVTKNTKISYDYHIQKMNVKKNFMFPKRNKIIHNIGIKKRNLLPFSNYPLRRRGYKKNSDLNFNFIQLWYGDNDYYENFVRGKNGIYRKSLKRIKRLDVDISELNEGLLNLPPLHPFTDEIYVMVANSISFDCHSSGPTKNRNEDYIWTSDRLGILDFDNVMIEGPKVYINKIKTNNFGNYLCSAENSIVRSIKITVIDLPNIDIVFTPVYETDTCSYDDLKSLQKLSEPMSYFTYKYDRSVRIDEPICLKNSNDGSTLIRPIVVMSVKRQNTINCSAECLRDLQCSLALLFAKNAPALALVKVLISYNGTKRILSPLRERRRSFVTHTLRRKDTNGHREYHRLAANMDPNSVNVVLLCSAGFYLVVGQKICAVCPPNTFSLEGENVCRNCPRGARSEPGARSCRLSLHLRKNTCPWKYVCGGAVCMLSCVIASCYVVSRLLRQQGSTEEIKTCRKTRKAPRKESHQKIPKNRPLSPSRVILSRLLKGSLSSSRATDSQETRFELWKEKNTLPPLPPIDFEL